MGLWIQMDGIHKPLNPIKEAKLQKKPQKPGNVQILTDTTISHSMFFTMADVFCNEWLSLLIARLLSGGHREVSLATTTQSCFYPWYEIAFIYLCVCARACVCERERERVHEGFTLASGQGCKLTPHLLPQLDQITLPSLTNPAVHVPFLSVALHPSFTHSFTPGTERHLSPCYLTLTRPWSNYTCVTWLQGAVCTCMPALWEFY